MIKISAIGFDWGGVILQNAEGSFNTAAARFLGIEKEQFSRAYFQYNYMANKGLESKSFEQNTEMWSAILSELGLSDCLDAFMAFVKTHPQGEVSQPMVDLLQQLKGQGWKLGLLSNTSLEGAQRIRREECVGLFDVTMYSAEIGFMKPEPEAFQKFSAALDVPIHELIFIDDSERSLSTADQLGYMPIHFLSKPQLVADLKSVGIYLES